MAEVDRLGALQVGVAGHPPVARAPRRARAGAPSAPRSARRARVGALAHEERQVGRHLVVARAAGVQLAADRADRSRSAAARSPCGCPRRRRERELAALELGGDARRGPDSSSPSSSASSTPARSSAARRAPRAADVLRPQAAIEADRGVEAREQRIGLVSRSGAWRASDSYAVSRRGRCASCVTGATGKVGNAVARRLPSAATRSSRWSATPRARARARCPAGVELARGDVTDPDSLRRGLRGRRGASSTAWGSSSSGCPTRTTFDRVNADGARNVVAAAREAGARRVVHTSTFDVFDAERGGTVSEDRSPTRSRRAPPTSAPSSAPRSSCSPRPSCGIEVVIFNPAGVFGPGPWAPAGLDGMLRDALRGRLPAVPPGGMTLAYVDDVADGHLAALRPRPARRALHPRRRLRDDRARSSRPRSRPPAAAGCRRRCPTPLAQRARGGRRGGLAA